nr:hypothetical protein [Vibrio variabilis]
MNPFFIKEEHQWVDLGDDIKRKLAMYGAVALEQDSIPLDIFNPAREDFLK